MRPDVVREPAVATRPFAPQEPFGHPALFYRGEDEYLAGILPFVLGGLACEEPVALAVPGSRLALLRTALGERAAEVRFTDMAEAGRNPGRVIPGVLRRFADAHPGRRVRIVGERTWPARTSPEYPACVQHEALVNGAFGGRPVTVLCPFDASALAGDVLADARVTHPVVITAGLPEPSGHFDPQAALVRCNEPLPAAAHATVVPFDAHVLPDVRDFALREASEHGMSAPLLQDLALVVSELTTNTVVHGGGTGTLLLWAEDGRLVCQVEDTGTFTDQLAGRRPARPEQIGGRGLLLVHRLSDLVRSHTGDRGTTMRSYLALR